QVGHFTKGGHLILPARGFISWHEKLRINDHDLLDFRQQEQDSKTVSEIMIGVLRWCESAGQEIPCLADRVNLQRAVGGAASRHMSICVFSEEGLNLVEMRDIGLCLCGDANI